MVRGGRAQPRVSGLRPLTAEELADLPPVRAEEHIPLALAILARTYRPARDDDDEVGFAVLSLVRAAAEWNERRPCPWPAFASQRMRWDRIRRFQLTPARAKELEVPLFLPGVDEDDEIERSETALEDPAFRQAEARRDAGELLAGLEDRERFVLERRFGVRGEAATREQIGRELGTTKEAVRQVEGEALRKLRKRVRRGTFTIPLDSRGNERLR